MVTMAGYLDQLRAEALAVLPELDRLLGMEVEIGPVRATVVSVDPGTGMVRLRHKCQRDQDVTLVLFADAWAAGAVVEAAPPAVKRRERRGGRRCSR